MILLNQIRRFHNYYWADDKELTRKLRPILGFTPAKLHLFKTAFFHKSMTNENPDAPTNERLEYLGDAIHSTVVAESIYKK